MAVDSASQRSRRALLGAALGAGAATVASALGRPAFVSAEGEPIVVGGEYLTPTSVTFLRNVTNDADVFFGWCQGAGRGVLGVSESSVGVWGQSTSGSGVYGGSDSEFGVWAESSASDQPAIVGQSFGDCTGVFGFSGSSDLPASPAQTGVYGYAGPTSVARGVHGQASAGRGVNGIASTGRGVHGQATSGTGVYASATTGYALRAVGRVKLDKCAGVATIGAAKKTVVVTPGIDLTTTSAVVATLQGNPGGTTTVQRVSINPTANTFTIYLTANSTTSVKVAWHVFG